MKKLIVAICVALGLVACGGGGSGSSDATSSTLALAVALKAKPVVTEPTLVGQEISLVNTTTAGDQVFGTIGALSDSGYTVAWVSGTSTLFQRYDRAGAKVGGEISMPFVGETAVLTGGDCVVVYLTSGPQGPDISFSRFDASGVLVAQGLAASTADYARPFLPGNFGYFHVSSLADGGFVVGWTVDYRSAQSETFVRRYDSQAAPAGSNILVSQFTGNTDFQLAADAEGGYSATLFYAGNRENDVLRIVHIDANGTMTTIVPPHLGDALLLPLEGDAYVLFALDSSGSPFRQFLDSAGNPVGDPVPIPALPFEAKELVDGSFIVFWMIGGSITAQRFDSAGAPMGDLLTLGSNGVAPGMVALADGGFASAWSAPGAAGDLDVFTQRFIEVLSPDQAALRAKRKACLANAKGMIGRERKAFMDACMQ
jgi:hypothetical protein